MRPAPDGLGRFIQRSGGTLKRSLWVLRNDREYAGQVTGELRRSRLALLLDAVQPA